MYGIQTQNNFSGFINSELPVQIVVASGYVNYSGSTVEYAPLNNKGIRRLQISNVTLTKHVNMDMAETYDSSNNYGRLKVGAFIHSTGGHSCHYGGAISENSSSLTFQRIDIDSGNQSSFSATSISGRLYIVLVASLGSINQVLPDNGIVCYSSNGQVTFNSNYMPAIPRVYLGVPSPNLSDMTSYNTGRVYASGVSNSQKPMVPWQYIGRGMMTGGYTFLGGVCLVYNTDNYISARSTGAGGVTSIPAMQYPIKYGNSTQIPILLAEDYF
ncbi:hypothetical protein R1U54_002296 [Vibrio fluvialis]|nr:hypothetical protein [Vibrio fluvialis]